MRIIAVSKPDDVKSNPSVFPSDVKIFSIGRWRSGVEIFEGVSTAAAFIDGFAAVRAFIAGLTAIALNGALGHVTLVALSGRAVRATAGARVINMAVFLANA